MNATQLSTSTTKALSFVADVSIGSIIRMPIFAMGLQTIRVVCKVISSFRIYRSRNCFQVVRPNAVAMGAATFANVIPIEAIRCFTNKKMVSKNRLSIRVKSTIASFFNRADPQSTAICATGIDMAPKQNQGIGELAGIYSNWHREPPFSLSMQPGVSASRLLSIVTGGSSWQ